MVSVECTHDAARSTIVWPLRSPAGAPGLSVRDPWSGDALADPGPWLHVASRRDGTELTITLIGDIDVANADDLGGQIRGLMAADGVQDVVMDLAQVDFCDGAGLRALLSAQRWALSRALGCRLVRLSPAVTYVWRSSGMAGFAVGIELGTV
ncbi:STAS domain-containing protein [Actinoplanes aureus]|uniref:STAS domain-containing protein n=1 Tax=Actinoplanes aureus TaxID=2792083 RepID=A0A931FY12_9ACTN|nr:STAS domain-containing protein [Actinoplanes aureus]MBG0561391.1 STAS domain-containing protein [Actinoplanes aureus]